MRWDASSRKFSTLTSGEATAQDIFGLKDRLIVTRDDGRLPYNEALYQWLRGYDYSYSNGILYPRAHMQADFGQSSIVMVNKPNPSAASLPGYQDWAKEERSRNNPPTLYAQTNDGILHVIDPANGNEKKTVLLPPVLLPTRLATLKTMPAADGKLMWLDVTAKDGADGARRSVAGFTLDGPLAVRRFSGIAANGGWGTYLLGTLGRGGNGLYMLDVSDHDDPKLMWYHEKYEDRLILMPPGASAPSTPSAAPLNYAAYAKLGYNSPAPAMGVVMTASGNSGMKNIIALAGGTQTVLNLSENGVEGAALLVLDPKDGSVLRAFDGNSVEYDSRIGGGVKGVAPYMGMMVAEPALLQTNDRRTGYAPYVAGRIYAADNRGNIFAVYIEQMGKDGYIEHLVPSEWKIRTVATLQESVSSGRRSGNSYAFPYGVVLAKDNNHVWIAGGTSNIIAKKGDAGTSNVVSNNMQTIFAFKSSDGDAAPLAMRDIQELPKSSLGSDAAMTHGGKGWYIKLDRVGGFDEYVSAKPMLIGKTLLVPTFTTTKTDSKKVTDICKASAKSVSGYSRIYALNLRDGSANLWEGRSPNMKMKYVQLEDLRITGLTKVNHGGNTSVLASFESMNDGKLPDIGQENAKYVKTMEAIEIKMPPDSSNASVTSGDSVIYYWKMK
jgi:type IV pilus assembly protein PilY1